MNKIAIRIEATKKQNECWNYLRDTKTKFIMFGGGAGGGKAQPLSSKVLTPSGFVKMGDVSVGDTVLTPNNKPSKVVAIHPQGQKEIFEMTFIDGSTIRVTNEHLFKCWVARRKQRTRIRNVKEIMGLLSKGKNILIPLSEPLNFGKDITDISPYLVGALLGDGGLTKNSITITSDDDEIIKRISLCLPPDNFIRKKKHQQYSITCGLRNEKGHCYNLLIEKLREYGLMGARCENKFVPRVFMNASLKTRLDLIKGLMDTDGTIDSRGHCFFCSKSKQLAKDLQYLIRSIGGKATLSEKRKFCTYKGERKEGTYYELYINTNDNSNLFHLSRKKERVKAYNNGNVLAKRIISIKPVGFEKAQCITIDSKEHLYVSDDFTITHNSWLGVEWTIYQCLKYAGAKMFIGRNELKRLMQSTFVTFLKVCKHHQIPREAWKLNSHHSYIEFYNGSRIDLLDVSYQPRDPMYERFGSTEYTSGWLEEVGEIKEKAYDILKSRIGRHLNKEYNIMSKLFMTCNPKKNWVYFLFYKPYKEGLLSEDSCFIQSLYKDNPHTAKEYEKNLLSIRDKQLRERLMHGNWEYEDDDATLMRYDRITDLFRPHNYEQDINGTFYLSVDVARFGRDKAVIVLWQGYIVRKVWSYDKSNLNFLKEKIQSAMAQYHVEINNVVIDEDGVGGGLVDELYGCTGFVNGSRPVEELYEDTQETVRYSYKNLRSQCYFILADHVNDGKMRITADLDPETQGWIIEELEAIKRKDVEKNESKLAVISKEEIKDTIGRSPDFADSLMMRFVFDLGYRGAGDVAVVW